MRFGKEIYNLQRRRNKRQRNSVMLEIMTSKITIDLNVFSVLMKNRVVNNLNRTLIVERRNKGQRNSVMFEIMTSKITIDLNVFMC